MVFQSPLRRESSTRSITDMYNSKGDTDLLSAPFLSGPNKKRLRCRRSVHMDLSQTTVMEIPSLDDLSPEEHAATYYQRNEYMQMRDAIRETVDYLRSPHGHGASIIAQAGHRHTSVDPDDGSVCVRGLECLADDFVGKHRKRVRQLSQSSVFAYQNMQRFRYQSPWTSSSSLFDGSESSSSDDGDGAAVPPPPAYYNRMDAEGLAQAYQRYTSECQCIAERWGTFDAMDAGINMGHKLL